MRGAMAYAWFMGDNTKTGVEFLQAITQENFVTILTYNTSTQQIGNANSPSTATDYSANALAYDGYLSYAFNPNTNAYYKENLSSSGQLQGLMPTASQNCQEFIDAFAYYWENFFCGPSEICVGAGMARWIDEKVFGGKTASTFHIMLNQDDTGKISGGAAVDSVLNRFTGERVPIRVQPYLPDDTILFRTTSLPYPAPGLGMLYELRLRRPMWQTLWPQQTFKWETFRGRGRLPRDVRRLGSGRASSGGRITSPPTPLGLRTERGNLGGGAAEEVAWRRPITRTWRRFS